MIFPWLSHIFPQFPTISQFSHDFPIVFPIVFPLSQTRSLLIISDVLSKVLGSIYGAGWEKGEGDCAGIIADDK